MARAATRRGGKLIYGLEQTAAFGVTTNQAFLVACLRHPAFAAGEATTAFIGKHRDELLAPRADADVRGGAGGAAALCDRSLRAAVAQRPVAGGDLSGRRLAIELDHGIHELEIVRERDGGYLASLDGDGVPLRDRRA